MEIDFVVLWVDGADPEWINSFNKYSEKRNVSFDSTIDISKKRYDDNGLLRYWFRGIEENAPWVHKVFFITSGQKPSWLNTNHKKICWVKHEDYISQEYLPVFNCNPLEVNLHRIKGLSDTFVYFNDDMYLINPIKENFFFRGGLPRDHAILNAIEPRFWGHIFVNNLIEINKYFKKHKSIVHNLFKWFNIQYGIHMLRTIVLLPWPKFNSFLVSHMPQAYLKSTYNEVWDHCEHILHATSTHRFRTIGDANQYIFRFWQLAKGTFSPSPFMIGKRFFNITEKNINAIEQAVKNKSVKEICLNELDDSPSCFERLQDILEKKFPVKSSFEL
ncbi:Stealth CR1 domain-containing protein [Treponema primitia]|uniref:Stealth CR1 domain-containing protein n=1 Tax=Treponema primitia TaxID=88058 RepID=UPI000255556B|nr:Stealth CR1 domain-containing protein [Treponema primitia]